MLNYFKRMFKAAKTIPNIATTRDKTPIIVIITWYVVIIPLPLHEGEANNPTDKYILSNRLGLAQEISSQQPYGLATVSYHLYR